MIPVNATALYVSACRSVLQCDPGQQQSFTEMYTLLPFFRQSLSCLVCGNLSQDPIAPANSTCQHHVCRGCKGQKMQLKPSCSWCKDYSSFEENRQLSLLVDLYRQLCLYISHTPLLQRISSQVGGSPEIMTLLNEMLVTEKEEEEVAAEEQQEEEEESSRVVEECKPPSPSLPVLDIPPPPAEVPPDPPPSVLLNGPESCNGVGLEEPAVPSSPELEVCDPMEEVALHILGTAACMVEREPEPEELDLAAAAATPQLPAQSCVLSFREAGGDCREVEEGEVLLLSVEEVLQTLEPSLDAETTTTHTQPDRTHTHTYLQHTHPNRTHLPHTHPQTDRLHVTAPPPNRPQPTHAQPERTHAVARQPALSLPPPVRRKRSHSESDRERVQPLPISCILHGPPETLTPPPPLPHQIQAPTHTYSILANGGPPRARSSLNKAARKHSDPGAKRPHSKPRPGPKAAKERARDRLLAGCLLPPGPAKPLYKKPVEKKGCKCGRATQNPSVLTCRGQRCPCYSNRKACLDCICRGCQNSYMANGEKKLEAFAVPEKALEQTRLTLGINLTSIAAAHLRGPSTGAVHGGALINVATTTGAPVGAAFLSPPSPPREPAYEDSLDLGFHC